MQARRHVAAVADRSVHEGEMQDGIETRAIGVARQLADRRLDRKCRDAFDELFARLPVGDEISHRNALQFVPVGEGLDLRPDHDRAVAQIDQRAPALRLEAPQNTVDHPAPENVADKYEVARAHVAVGERAHGVGALLGRNAGSHAVLHVDRNGEGGAERRVVDRHHRGKVKAASVVGGERRTDNAAAVPDDEGHFFGRAQRGCDDEVALVLAIVVVGDNDDLAAPERLDGGDSREVHVVALVRGRRLDEEIVRRDRAARLGDDPLGRLARQPSAVLAAD